MSEESNGSRAILKWWPIAAFVLVWSVTALAAFFSLRAEVIAGRMERIGQINELKMQITAHEREEAETKIELNRRLERIETLQWEINQKIR